MRLSSLTTLPWWLISDQLAAALWRPQALVHAEMSDVANGLDSFDASIRPSTFGPAPASQLQGRQTQESTPPISLSPYTHLPVDFSCPPGSLLRGRFCYDGSYRQAWPVQRYYVLCRFATRGGGRRGRTRSAARVEVQCPEEHVCMPHFVQNGIEYTLDGFVHDPRPRLPYGRLPPPGEPQLQAQSSAVQEDYLYGHIDCVPRGQVDWPAFRVRAAERVRKARRNVRMRKVAARAAAAAAASTEAERAEAQVDVENDDGGEASSSAAAQETIDRSWQFGWVPGPMPDGGSPTTPP